MMDRRPVLGDCTPVCFGRVTFVAVPVVVRKFLVQAEHVVVAISFSQNTGRGNGQVLPISLDNAMEGSLTRRG